MNKILVYIAAGLIIFSTIQNSFYILDQRQTALVLQFGEPVDHKIESGLKFKIPFIQDVLFFDHRIQDLSADTTEVISSDQKTMRVDAFTKYRIIDALQFYQRTKDDVGFRTRLAPILDSSLRQVLGSSPFKALLTAERASLMRKIKDIVNREAKDFGIEVVDVRIMRADLPEKSREAVYDRMRSERAKEAKEIRAEGAEQAQIITSTADKEKQIIIAESRKNADILRGEGDSQAIKSFANAFNKDPEFYEFYRSMQAYRKTFNKGDTKIILSPESEFLKYFKKPQ